MHEYGNVYKRGIDDHRHKLNHLDHDANDGDHDCVELRIANRNGNWDGFCASNRHGNECRERDLGSNRDGFGKYHRNRVRNGFGKFNRNASGDLHFLGNGSADRLQQRDGNQSCYGDHDIDLGCSQPDRHRDCDPISDLDRDHLDHRERDRHGNHEWHRVRDTKWNGHGFGDRFGYRNRIRDLQWNRDRDRNSEWDFDHHPVWRRNNDDHCHGDWNCCHYQERCVDWKRSDDSIRGRHWHGNGVGDVYRKLIDRDRNGNR